MSLELILALAGLALIDSMSFSAVGVPVFLLLSSPTPPVRRMAIYLTTIVVFFFTLGVAIMLGLDRVLASTSGLLESRAAYWVQLAIGVGLFALSFRFDSKKATGRSRSSLIPASDSAKTMVVLGFTTSLLEVATMLPYLAAIGLLTAAGLPAAQWAPLLGGYTLVMILPPLSLLAISIVARDWLRPYLERLGHWLERHGRDVIGWTLGIVGFFLALNAASELNLIEFLLGWVPNSSP